MAASCHAHDIPAYENYLARYPQGEYAREARTRIKELKRKKAAPLPVKRYATIGGGALALLLAIWLVPNMFRSTADKKSNQLGLFDMTGNVWEWCSDTYKTYPCDSKNTAEGSDRVIRGGGWNNEPQNCRSANRNRNTPTNRNNDIGFRLAASSF